MVNGNSVSATAGGLAGLTPANNVLTATELAQFDTDTAMIA